MTIIIDNQDANRRPDAPVPAGLNSSVPLRSDTVQYTGSLFNHAPFLWGQFPNEVAVMFMQLSRQRTWDNLSEFHTSVEFGGHYEEQATEGVTTATGVVERWEQSLGVAVTAGWGPLSATISANLSQGGEHSVTVELYKSISRTIVFDFDKGIEAEAAAWQLEESYILNCWIYVWSKIEGADPSKVTAAMVETARQELESALRENRKPLCRQSSSLPRLISSTNQYTTTSSSPHMSVNSITAK